MENIDYHQGERLKKFIEDNGINKKLVYDHLKVTKQAFYQMLKRPLIKNSVIMEVVTLSCIDGSGYFPHLKDSPVYDFYSKGLGSPMEILKLQNKMIKLQEDKIELLEEISNLKKEVASLKRQLSGK
jgi:hypothetical protein